MTIIIIITLTLSPHVFHLCHIFYLTMRDALINVYPDIITINLYAQIFIYLCSFFNLMAQYILIKVTGVLCANLLPFLSLLCFAYFVYLSAGLNSLLLLYFIYNIYVCCISIFVSYSVAPTILLYFVDNNMFY